MIRARQVTSREIPLPLPLHPWAGGGGKHRTDIAVVTSHYNFAGFAAPRRNLQRWLREMAKEGVAVFGTELTLAGQVPQTAGLDGWIQHEVGPEAMLWQKEALVNATVRRVPSSFRCIVEVDADLWFESATWLDDTVAMLDRHPAGQPFATAVWTGAEGEVDLTRESACAAGFGVSPWRGHTGFAWAWRRDFFDAVGGFFDRGILGGGDLLWCAAAIGDEVSAEAAAMRVGLDAASGYGDYYQVVRARLAGTTLGYAPGRVWHEYHGARRDRRYEERATILQGFVPQVHVRHHPAGYLVWTAKAPAALRKRIAAYFATRKEDG